MSAIGAKYKWKEGKILHASRLWKAPSKRRIPRMINTVTWPRLLIWSFDEWGFNDDLIGEASLLEKHLLLNVPYLFFNIELNVLYLGI